MRQRNGPAMTEDDRLTRAPVIVIDLRAILGRDGAHGGSPLCCATTRRAPAAIRAARFGETGCWRRAECWPCKPLKPTAREWQPPEAQLARMLQPGLMQWPSCGQGRSLHTAGQAGRALRPAETRPVRSH